MIQKLKNIPIHMLGFEVYQHTTEQEFKDIIVPDMVELIQRTGKLNFLLVYDGDFGGFRMGEWLKDAMVKLHCMAKWNQVAVITSTLVVSHF